MIFKRKARCPLFVITYSLFLLMPFAACYAQGQAMEESDQQISEFSLVGYSERGEKTWDLAGKTADIFEHTVKLKDIAGNLYGEEDVNLTADKGDFDKKEGRVHLQENVIITTSSGAKLTTESLDWDRKNRLVTTQEAVNIVKENMITTALGAKGQPDLNRVTLEKEVRVDINPVDEKNKETAAVNKTVITCDGPLEIDYANNIAVFKNNVLVDTQDNLIYSDIMEVYFVTSGQDKNNEDAAGSMFIGAQIEKIIAKGNVKIVRGENVSYSEEAFYNASDKKIILTGRPRLVIYSSEDLDASFRN